jgi:steroid 5-alpha reductase family enzyme
MGLTLPLQPTIAADAAPLNGVDAAAVAVCVTGLAIGCAADNQLRTYMLMRSSSKPIILETGL